MKLQDKVAIITGASRGIGRATSKLFAKEGAKVAINYNKSEKEATNLLEEIQKYGGETILVKADVSKANEVKEMVRKTVEKFGRIDILVNNAGVAVMKPFLELSEEDISFHLDVNLKGCFFCSQVVLPEMIKRHYGKIINIASISGVVGLPTQSAYSASKAGIISLTEVLAMEMGEHGINVNAIAPGIIDTEMTKNFNQPKLMDILLIKRKGKAEEVANYALFLASPDSDYITGTTLLIDGGWSTGYKLK